MPGPICYWQVADVEGTVAALLAAGGRLHQVARDVGGGKRLATVKDADGNVIGLSTQP